MKTIGSSIMASLSNLIAHDISKSKRNSTLDHEFMVQRLSAWRAEKTERVIRATNQSKALAANCSKGPAAKCIKATSAGRRSYLGTAQTSDKQRCTKPFPSSVRRKAALKENVSAKNIARNGPRLHSSKDAGGTPKKLLFATPHGTNRSRNDTLARSFNTSVLGLSTPNASMLSASRASRRKLVSFADPVPVRCSPRLHKPSQAVCESNLDVSTPSAPGTDVNLDMRQKLQEWLATKGKTPSRFHNLLNFKRTPPDMRRKIATRRATPAKLRTPVWQMGIDDHRVSPGGDPCRDEVQTAMDKTMDECTLLLEQGCPLHIVSEWLDSLAAKVPSLCQCAKYWLCRVAIAQQENEHANEIINIYEEAVLARVQPIHEIKASLIRYVSGLVKLPSAPSQPPPPRTPSSQAEMTSHACRTPEINDGGDSAGMDELLQSSVVKYFLTESTSYFDRIRKAIGDNTPGASPRLTFITPVRRSIRIDRRRSHIPSSLRHQPCLGSLDQLQSSEGQEFVLRSNLALDDNFLEEGHRMDI